MERRRSERHVGKEREYKRKDSAEDDGFSYICAVCSDFGELLCCERCRDGFHLSCLGLDECPDFDPWLCSTCVQNKVRCFQCKAFGVLGEDLVKCTHKICSKYYHTDCIKKWTRTSPKTVLSATGLVCPHHYCDCCVDTLHAKLQKLFVCLRCPIAYHETCSPEGTSLLEDIPGHLICWKHDDEWKHENQDPKPGRDPKLFFERLPLPSVAIDFQIPSFIFDYARRLQKRPPSYCHIRRNLYLVKRSRRWQEDDRMECPCKDSPGSKEACSKDCLCGMLFTSCSSNCGCGESCANVPFQKRPGCKMKTVKTEKCGWGLIADEDIKAGAFLIEYVGEVIDDETCERRLWVMKKQGEMNFYMCEISREMVIDATFKGNLSRYINHSCHPNSELQKWEMDGEIRIGVFATTDIKCGEFITYDYQFIQFGTDQNCHCGASDCRGQLGKPMKRHKREEIRVNSLTSSALPRTLKKSNLCGNFSLQHAPQLGAIYRQRKTSILEAGDVGVVQALPSEQTRKAKLVGLRIRVWWPLDQKFYHGKILSYDGYSGGHEICYDDGEIEALCLLKERWEVEQITSSKSTQRKRRFVSPGPCVLNGEVVVRASKDAVGSGIESGRSGPSVLELPE